LASKKGGNTQKPLHTPRKEFGSLVSQTHGIHAASKALRHADINVTNNFYTDSGKNDPQLNKYRVGKFRFIDLIVNTQFNVFTEIANLMHSSAVLERISLIFACLGFIKDRRDARVRLLANE
jgi:hypothetical protein